MVTQKQFKEHYINLYKNGAIYVWGANGEIITQELIDKLYKTYGSTKYNRTYYNNKLVEGKGKIGADCSGSFYPLSKGDATVKGYYQSCQRSGKVGVLKDMPRNVACMVFNKDFTHIGAYMGDGTTIEMMNSTRNCVKQNLNESRWDYYGIPNWLEGAPENNAPVVIPEAKINPEVVKNIQEWCNEYCNAGLIIDGKFGPKTKKALCMALQTYLNRTYNAGLQVDGNFGAKTKAACKTCNGKNELAYICQAMLYYKGYNMNHSIKNQDLDGSYGTGTKRTVLEYQQDTRGLKHDGKCGPATFYALFNS